MTTSRTARWLARLLVLFASIVVGLAGIEVLVRVAGMDDPLVWQPNPKVGWWHIPRSKMHWRAEGDGLVEINSAGLRDVERPVTKPAGVFRIAVFGDSMTEGVQVNVDQTYTQRLEGLLQKRGLRVEVLNFGVNGYSPLQGYLLYDQVGKTFSPDLVLHAVFLDNDIADGDLNLAVGQTDAPFVVADAGPGLQIDYSQSEASYREYHREPIFSMRRFLATYRLTTRFRAQRRGQTRFNASTIQGNGIPKRYLLYADPTAPEWNKAWTTFERIEEAFAADVRAQGSAFAMVSVPTGLVADPRTWDELQVAFPAIASGRWRLPGPEERFRAMAEARHLTIIAPTDEFRKQADRVPLFFGGAGHLTPQGHALMAAALADALEADGLLDAAPRSPADVRKQAP